MCRTVGVILIVLGFVGLAWGGIRYVTQERVLDAGPIHAARERTHVVPIPPVAGVCSLFGGIALLAFGGKD